MLFEHERGGNHDGTQLAQGSCHKPELVVTTQDNQNVIALLDALRSQVIRRLIRPFTHVSKREEMLFAFGIAPHHGTAIGIVFGNVIDNVVTEVE